MSPTYTYKCTSCDFQEDLNKSIDARDVEHKCSQCNQLMKRAMSTGIGAIFQGNGWGSKP
jgi:putative FmdB family regulatory protein